MKQTVKIFLIIIPLLSFGNSFAQWTKLSSIPTNDIVELAVNNNKIYAVSDSTEIYESSDMGFTWTTLSVSSSPIDITSLIFYNNKIYAGTFRFGIFSSSDNGSTWQKNNSNVLSISGFAVKDNFLYASTYGNGVAVLDTNTNKWVLINDSLPSYSVNVQRIISSLSFLIIAAGANGTFYKYNFSTHSWDEKFYYGFLRPGLIIDNLISFADTIFAVNGNRIIKSSDAGESWEDDKIGTHNGFYRTIYFGLNNEYLLTNVIVGDLIAGGTWIQKRDKYSKIGTTWSTGEEFIPKGYSYDIIEFGNKLFLGRDDGLYIKFAVTDVSNSEKNDNDIFDYKLKQNYPNPFNPLTKIKFSVPKDGFVQIKVYDTLGKEIRAITNEYKHSGNYEVEFDAGNLPSGVYFYRILSGIYSETKKMILLR